MGYEEIHTVQVLIDDLNDKLDIYDRIIEEELYRDEELPNEVSNQIRKHTADYETVEDALTQFSKHIAYQRYKLKEELMQVGRNNVDIDIHKHYQQIDDELWNIPSQLDEIDGVELPEPSFGQIVVGNELPDFEEEY